MSEPWIDLLRQAVARHPRGAIGVGHKIGYARSAISMVLAGTYPAATTKIAQAVLDHYDRPVCPLVATEIDRARCRRLALIPEPRGGDARARWHTCQTCEHKPKE